MLTRAATSVCVPKPEDPASLRRFDAQWVVADLCYLAKFQKQGVKWGRDPWVRVQQRINDAPGALPGLFHVMGVPVLLMPMRGHAGERIYVSSRGKEGQFHNSSGLVCVFNQNDVNAVNKQDDFDLTEIEGSKGVFRVTVPGESSVALVHNSAGDWCVSGAINIDFDNVNAVWRE